ncbi:MAG TPA: transposase [Gemmataceae bacterium]|nr:transposase [Gemmataceae bacterium]
MRRAFRYRLRTTTHQQRELAIALESHRRLYNQALQQRKTVYQTEQRSFSFVGQCRWFTQQRASNPFFARLNAASGQETLRRLDRAFAHFFRRIKEGAKPGYPRFKGRDRFDSFTFRSYGDGIKLLDNNRLRVHNVGTIRVKLHRPTEGTIKTATLKREADKWFVVFSCELPDVPLADNGKPAVGIDVGLESFLTTSDGEREPNPRYLKKELPALRRAGRAVARKRKGGSKRRKAARRLQTIHARVKNVRHEHHYQVACRLVLAYGLIAVESLNIQGMLGNGRLARAIADAAWGAFVSILKHKAAKAGVAVVEVDPKGTSQECSGCGQEVQKDLSVRWHDCPYCGLSLDRDHNAASNILARGLARTGPAGVNVTGCRKRPPRSHRVYATESSQCGHCEVYSPRRSLGREAISPTAASK